MMNKPSLINLNAFVLNNIFNHLIRSSLASLILVAMYVDPPNTIIIFLNFTMIGMIE